MDEPLTCQMKATLHLLTHSEGGRRTAIKKEYKPIFMLDSRKEICRIDDIDDRMKEMLLPGESGYVKISIAYPGRFGEEMCEGSRFEIHEGKRMIGCGIIEKIVEY